MEEDKGEMLLDYPLIQDSEDYQTTPVDENMTYRYANSLLLVYIDFLPPFQLVSDFYSSFLIFS